MKKDKGVKGMGKNLEQWKRRQEELQKRKEQGIRKIRLAMSKIH